jgi:hypothetical protein
MVRFIGHDYHIIAIKSMTINCGNAAGRRRSRCSSVPGHGAPGGEWSRQDRPPRLDHVARLATERPDREFRLDHTDGSKKLSSQRQCSFPVVAGEAAMRGRCCLAGQLLVRFLEVLYRNS